MDTVVYKLRIRQYTRIEMPEKIMAMISVNCR